MGPKWLLFAGTLALFATALLVSPASAQQQRCVPIGGGQYRCYQEPTSLRPTVPSPGAEAARRAYEDAMRARHERELMRRDYEFQLELQRRQQEHELQLERMRQQGLNPR